MPPSQLREIMRKDIIDMVLATDMKQVGGISATIYRPC